MRSTILLLAFFAVAITSCTSVYKTGQTPDDVYFSPQRPEYGNEEYLSMDDNDRYYNGEDYYSDRYLRMKVQNRTRWSELNDWYYNDRFSYSYYNSLYYLNNPWSPISYWNTFYNPYYSYYGFYSPYGYYSPYSGSYYYSPIYMGGGKNSYTIAPNRARIYNLNTYSNNMLNSNNYTIRNVNVNTNNAPSRTSQRYTNYNNSSRNAGDYLRNSNNNRYNNTNTNRTYNYNNTGSSGSRSSGSSGSGSSRSGGSAPVRKF